MTSAAETITTTVAPVRLLDVFLNSLGLDWRDDDIARPLIARNAPPDWESTGAGNIAFYDSRSDFREEDRFVNTLAAVLVNSELADVKDQSIGALMTHVDLLTGAVDYAIQNRIGRVIKSESYRNLEKNWRGLSELVDEVKGDSDKNEVIIDFLDATKAELGQDLEDHDADVLSSDLFRRIYVNEYDRLGGRPFGAVIGLFDFGSDDDATMRADLSWLKTMGKICRSAHAPFISALNAKFLGLSSYDELDRIRDVEDHLALPKYGEWNAFRESDAAAYIGLTLPRYLLRKPWNTSGPKGHEWRYVESVDSKEDYLWGNTAILFGRNLVHSFEESGWCQHICGPLGGGCINGLPVHTLRVHDRDEVQPPVEIAVPDYRELQFARAGFIPLVHCKGEASASFFSARSIKKAHEFEGQIDTQNSDLVCNLAYTLSVTRIAHYVKRMVRDYIGSSADAAYIQSMLEKWLADYVTTVVNPDDLTLRSYPFKAVSVTVKPKPGPLGWYQGIVSILPHIKFEGMDVELRLEAALGGA